MVKIRETVIRHKEQIIYIALGVYVAAVLWLTLVDRSPAYKLHVLTPFWSYGKILEGNFDSLKENLENIALFIPVGYFLRMFLKKDLKKTALIGFLISLGIELIQLITTLGFFEPDDLLHNSLGTLIGWHIWKYVPEKVEIDFKKISRFGITAVISTLILLIGSSKLVNYINYQRMISYAALNDSAKYKNLLVLNGNDGYCWNTDVNVVYQDDGSLRISGISDKRSWYTIGDIKLDAGTYVFTGLSGVAKNTVAIELEYYDKNQHNYIRLVQDVGPVEQVEFTLEKTTKIRAYVGVYEGCNCDITARPAIYKEE